MVRHRKRSSRGNPRNLGKRIASYTIAAGAVLSLSNRGHTAVVYTNPTDHTLDGEWYPVDIDGDGVDDFKFRTLNGRAYVGKAYGENAIELTLIGTETWTPRLPSGQSIAATANWNTADRSLNYYVDGVSGGPFNGSSGYIGVKFVISPNVHYGWIRYEGDTRGGGTIRDWAYQDDSALTSINAGKKTNTNTSTTTWSDGPPNNKDADAIINGPLDLTAGDITVRDLTISASSTLSFTNGTITVHGDVYSSSLAKRLSVGGEGSVVLHSPIVIDSIPPVPGVLSLVGTTLTWSASDDISPPGSLRYHLYKSNNTTDLLNTVALVEAATEVTDRWETVLTTRDITGDIDFQPQRFNVIVQDEAGNKSIYIAVQYPGGGEDL